MLFGDAVVLRSDGSAGEPGSSECRLMTADSCWAGSALAVSLMVGIVGVPFSSSRVFLAFEVFDVFAAALGFSDDASTFLFFRRMRVYNQGAPIHAAANPPRPRTRPTAIQVPSTGFEAAEVVVVEAGALVEDAGVSVFEDDEDAVEEDPRVLGVTSVLVDPEVMAAAVATAVGSVRVYPAIHVICCIFEVGRYPSATRPVGARMRGTFSSSQVQSADSFDTLTSGKPSFGHPSQPT